MAYYAVFDTDGNIKCIQSDLAGIDESDTTELLPEDFDPELTRYEDGEWVSNAEAYDIELKLSLTLDAEQVNSAAASGTTKPYIYAMKAFEMFKWSQLTAFEQAALTTEEKQAQFPFAYQDAIQFGDSVADAIARFSAGYASSVANIAQTEALLQKTIRDVSLAETREEKRAAADGWTDSLS